MTEPHNIARVADNRLNCKGLIFDGVGPMTVADGGTFEIANVVQSTFRILGRNFRTFLLLAVVLIGVPGAIIQFASALIQADPAAAALGGFVALVGGIINIVFSFLFQAALVTGVISDLNGRKLEVGEMIAGRVSLIPVLFGLAMLQTIAMMVGFILFVVPGLILMTIWVVTVPAVVVNKSGVFDAFTRSSDLTRGHRWPIFGLLVAYFLAVIIISVAGVTLFGGVGGMVGAARGGPNLILIVYNVAFGIIYNTLAATGVAVIYYELRKIKEGVAPRALVDTFS